MTTTTIDLGARYRVERFPGVAFYLTGHAKHWTEGGYSLDCAVGGCDHTDDDGDMDPACWAYDEPELVEDPDVVLAVMVGDDMPHLVDVGDLIPLEEGDWCAVCGQIGCTHDGRER